MLFFFGHEACGILAPWPRTEPAPPELEGKETLNHRTTREVPFMSFFFTYGDSHLLDDGSQWAPCTW